MPRGQPVGEHAPPGSCQRGLPWSPPLLPEWSCANLLQASPHSLIDWVVRLSDHSPPCLDGDGVSHQVGRGRPGTGSRWSSNPGRSRTPRTGATWWRTSRRSPKDRPRSGRISHGYWYDGTSVGSDGMVAAVVLAGDAVEALHLDRVGCADGRLQLGAAGRAFRDGSHLRAIGDVNRIVVKTSCTPLRLSREDARPWTSNHWYGMESIAYQSIPSRMHSIG